jgi:antitoxin ChpS
MATLTILETEKGPALSVPKSEVQDLHLEDVSYLDVTVEGESFVLRPHRKPKYTLQELLDQCDYSIPMDKEEREWLDAPRVGRELI